MNTILTVVDFTEVTLNAVATATALSKQLQLNLHLIYTPLSDKRQVEVGDRRSFPGASSEYIGWELARVQQLATTISQEQSITCTASYQEGVIHEVVVAEALSIQADLLVMGVHVGSDKEAFRTSNEAYQIITKTFCSVRY